MKRRGERQENRVIGRNRFHEVRSQDGEAVSRRTAAQEVRGSNPVGPMKEERRRRSADALNDERLHGFG